jgi:TolB protein
MNTSPTVAPSFRPLAHVIAGLLAACGGSPRVAAPTAATTGEPPAAQPTAEAVVARRDAPVPPADPARERIAFVRAGSIWIMDAAGGDEVQLSVRSRDGADDGPALSPRGDAIAYSSPRDGATRLYVIGLEELVPRAITDGSSGGDRQPAWSPDGRRIAFVRGGERDRRDLYLVDASGGDPDLLFAGDDDHPALAGGPAWSPDGRSIVFGADRRRGRGTTLWIVDVATRALRPLTVTRNDAWFVVDREPAWSPDGRRIAFASNRHAVSRDHADSFDLYAVDADGGNLTRLTDDPDSATDPSYSPDGARLYFASTRGRQNDYEVEIYVMAAEGGRQRRVTRDERPQNRAPSAGPAQ